MAPVLPAVAAPRLWSGASRTRTCPSLGPTRGGPRPCRRHCLCGQGLSGPDPGVNTAMLPSAIFTVGSGVGGLVAGRSQACPSRCPALQELRAARHHGSWAMGRQATRGPPSHGRRGLQPHCLGPTASASALGGAGASLYPLSAPSPGKASFLPRSQLPHGSFLWTWTSSLISCKEGHLATNSVFIWEYISFPLLKGSFIAYRIAGWELFFFLSASWMSFYYLWGSLVSDEQLAFDQNALLCAMRRCLPQAPRFSLFLPTMCLMWVSFYLCCSGFVELLGSVGQCFHKTWEIFCYYVVKYFLPCSLWASWDPTYTYVGILGPTSLQGSVFLSFSSLFFRLNYF